MVAWSITLFTPQYPNGRDIIVIGNDITHQIGSFGPKEDLLFQVTIKSTYIHTYLHTYTHKPTYTHKHTYIHKYIHTYIHTYIRTYVHTYIHTCTYINSFTSW